MLYIRKKAQLSTGRLRRKYRLRSWYTRDRSRICLEFEFTDRRDRNLKGEQFRGRCRFTCEGEFTDSGHRSVIRMKNEDSALKATPS